MALNKVDFFNELSHQISDPIYLTDKTDEINEEIKFNFWTISASPEIISQTSSIDYLEFIQRVKDEYKNQLNNSRLEIDLIYYLWFDEMSGQLCFNFINSNHATLPFNCKVEKAETPEEIINHYLQITNHGLIPWDELKEIVTQEQIEISTSLEKENEDVFVLTVYKEIIKKRE